MEDKNNNRVIYLEKFLEDKPENFSNNEVIETKNKKKNPIINFLKHLKYKKCEFRNVVKGKDLVFRGKLVDEQYEFFPLQVSKIYQTISGKYVNYLFGAGIGQEIFVLNNEQELCDYITNYERFPNRIKEKQGRILFEKHKLKSFKKYCEKIEID